MYLTTPGSRDGGSRVLALNAATGETLGEFDPFAPIGHRAVAVARAR